MKYLWRLYCFIRGEHEPAGPTGWDKPIKNHYCKHCDLALCSSYGPWPVKKIVIKGFYEKPVEIKLPKHYRKRA